MEVNVIKTNMRRANVGETRMNNLKGNELNHYPSRSVWLVICAFILIYVCRLFHGYSLTDYTWYRETEGQGSSRSACRRDDQSGEVKFINLVCWDSPLCFYSDVSNTAWIGVTENEFQQSFLHHKYAKVLHSKHTLVVRIHRKFDTCNGICLYYFIQCDFFVPDWP